MTFVAGDTVVWVAAPRTVVDGTHLVYPGDCGFVIIEEDDIVCVKFEGYRFCCETDDIELVG